MAFFFRASRGRKIKTALIVLLACIFLIVGCTGSKKSPEYLYGKSLYEKYIDLYLKGDTQLAEHSFYKSLVALKGRDDMCNVSRLFISRYFVNENYDDYSFLNRAKKYADIKECKNEENLIKLLKGEEYKPEYLSELYKAYADFVNGNNFSRFLAEVKSEGVSDSAKSRFYRLLADSKIVLDVSLAENLISKAYKIDSFHAWKLNIYRDLKLKYKICKQKNEAACNNLKIRMSMIMRDLDNN